MSQNGTLYPVIKSESEVNIMIDKKLNESRISEMNNQKAILARDLKRYKKIKRRWNNADLALKIAGTALVCSGAIAGVCVGVIAPPLMIPLFIPTLPIIVGVLTAAEPAITSKFVIGLTSRKKVAYKKKCKIIQSCLDRMYYYILKCNEDGIISIDELEKFRKLVENNRLEINGVYDPIVDPDIFKEATKLAKKEIQKEAVEEMKKELINSRLPLPQNGGKIQKILE